MKKICYVIILLLFCTGVRAESARSILDKAAQTVSSPGGAQADFKMISQQFGTVSGAIAIKGSKFHVTTPQTMIWFDGKTLWTYMKQNEEVNVSTPSEAELQAINPYNFINIYKNGFKLDAKTVGTSHEVHLKATDSKRKIQEMYITVDKKSYRPTQVKMRRNNKWSTIQISGLKTARLSDSLFRFSAKDFPNAEVIDLR